MGWATRVASVCTLTVAGMKGMGMNSRITLALEPRLGLCTPSVRPPYPHSHEVTALFPCNYLSSAGEENLGSYVIFPAEYQ